jgi:CubicO group peptidase (beta-lactamase class C family)
MVGDKRLVAAEPLQELYRAQPATGRSGYGLGFNIIRRNDEGIGDRVRHIGASGTLALLDFKEDLVVVLLTQVPAKQTQPFTDRVMKAIAAVCRKSALPNAGPMRLNRPRCTLI